jgi:hypothetical protein
MRVFHFELHNTFVERRSIILGDDSFGNLSLFDSLAQKQGNIKGPTTNNKLKHHEHSGTYILQALSQQAANSITVNGPHAPQHQRNVHHASVARGSGLKVRWRLSRRGGFCGINFLTPQLLSTRTSRDARQLKVSGCKNKS